MGMPRDRFQNLHKLFGGKVAMKWALKGFLGITGKSLKNMKIQTGNAIHSFASSPVENLSILLASAAFLVSLVAFIVALISFICSGGYVIQLKEIDAVGPIDYRWNSGNVSVLTGGVFGIISKILLCIGFFLLMVHFWSKSRLFMQIGSIIALLLSGSSMGLMMWLSGVWYGRIKPTGIWLSFALKILRNDADVSTLFNNLILISIIAFAVLLLILAVSECKSLFWHICRTAVFSLIAMPLILLVIENIVALAATVFLAIMVRLFIRFLLEALADSNRESGGAEIPVKQKTKTEKAEHEVKRVKTLKYPAGTRLFSDEGGGLVAPLGAKCIFAESPRNAKEYVCTYKDYKEQNVIIFIDGKQVTNL